MNTIHEPPEDEFRCVLESLRPTDSELAVRDELTDLYNRRLLSKLFEESWDDLTTLCGEFSLIMIDLDFFKEVNDRYGHLSGDRVLRIASSVLREHFRKGDFIFRYGGDEFLILLPGVGRAEAGQLAERARQAMSEHEFLSHETEEKIDLPLTFSVGVSSYPAEGTTPEELIAYADHLLYQEKQQVRRRALARGRTISRVVAALAVVSIAVLLFLIRDDGPVSIEAVEAPRFDKPSVEVEGMNAERMLLLEQIERLESRIEELQESQSRSNSTETLPLDRSGEIELLREQVRQLTAQVQERAALVRTEPTVETETIAQLTTEPVAPPRPPPVARRETAPPRVSEPPVRITTPRLLEPIRPRYPPAAQRFGKEATVELILRVDDGGRVIHARTVGPRAGFGFEEAAIEAVKQSSWLAGRRNDQPVEMETALRVTFRMPS